MKGNKEIKNLENVGIYMWLNTFNNKVYVGSSSRLKQRKQEHFRALKKGSHHNPHLQASFNKHGLEMFKFIILERGIPRDQLIERETHWIKLKDCMNPKVGYNMGVPQKDAVVKHRPETLHKLRIIALKQYYGDLPEEELLDLQEENKFVPMDPDVVIANQIKRFGKPLTCICNKTNEVIHTFDSFGQAMKELDTVDACIRRVLNKPNLSYRGLVILHSELYDPTASYIKQYKPKYVKKGRALKPVNSYTKDGTFLKTYTSVKEAAEDIGGNVKGIRKAISGERHSHRDLVFSYN